MIFETELEFRGFSKKVGKERNYLFVNLEDISGESIKLGCTDNINPSDYEKGDHVVACIEYNPTYKSLRCVDLIKN